MPASFNLIYIEPGKRSLAGEKKLKMETNKIDHRNYGHIMCRTKVGTDDDASQCALESLLKFASNLDASRVPNVGGIEELQVNYPSRRCEIRVRWTAILTK